MTFFDVAKNESWSSNESIKTFNGNVEFFPRFKKRVRRSSNRFDVLRVKRRIFRRFDSFVVFRVKRFAGSRIFCQDYHEIVEA